MLQPKGDGKKVAIQHYDQLGRVRLSRTLEDASSEDPTDETDGIKVQTRYRASSSTCPWDDATGPDELCTAQLVSNPYRADYSYNAGSEGTMGWTVTRTQNNGKRSETETYGGAALPKPFVSSGYNTNTTGVVKTEPDANATTVTDQAGKLRRSITNALGQLTRVDEPNSSNVLGSVSSPNQATEYTYDVFNNLLTVGQGSQTRTFTYSSVSRLLTAANPESGTIRYGYDPNGNLQTKWDARDIKTIYDYDELNRVKKRCYKVRPTTLGAITCSSASGETAETNTPDVTYTYDNVTNAIGKLTKVSSSVSATEYTAFDILGKVTGHKQTIGGNDYTTVYTYNLAGALIEETYPSGRMVKNTYATDGNLSQLETKPSGGSYATRANNFVYNAAGATTSLQLGNSKYENTVFNSRLQPTQIALGTTSSNANILQLDYTYGSTANNGNVLSQTITVPGVTHPFVQNYTYDSLNRLESATETYNSTQTWKQEFSYDRYGNKNYVTGSGHTTTLGSCSAAQCNPTFNTSTNRFSSGQGYTYDSSGNITVDAEGREFTYDAENKQIQVTLMLEKGGLTTMGSYFYDGDGKRVKKTSYTSDNIIFIYDASGKLIEERNSSSGALITSYVYAGSRLLSTETSSATTYLTADHLGSPRINTDGSGNVVARHDYMPFGEEIFPWLTAQRTSGVGYSSGGDGVRKQFTGYERDGETELDFAQARYHNNVLGRLSSPDSFTNDTHIVDPQSWNLYVYVRNNPLSLVDTTGTKATVTYHHDPDTGITTIKIKGSFTVYGAKGQDVSQEDLDAYAKLIKSGIEGKFNQQFAVDGKKFVMSADISVSVAKNEEAAMASGADNIAELGYLGLSGSGGDASASAYRVEGESFDRMVASITPGGAGGLSASLFENIFAHEFGAHLMSGYHNRDNPDSLFYGNSGSGQDRFLQSDFERMFSPTDPMFTGDPPNSRIIKATNLETGKNFSRVLTTNAGGGVETRRAHTVYATNPNNWVKAVKK